MSRLGPQQLGWVAEHGFPNGGRAIHLGPILIILPTRQPTPDPEYWNETRHPAPKLSDKWRILAAREADSGIAAGDTDQKDTP